MMKLTKNFFLKVIVCLNFIVFAVALLPVFDTLDYSIYILIWTLISGGLLFFLFYFLFELINKSRLNAYKLNFGGLFVIFAIFSFLVSGISLLNQAFGVPNALDLPYFQYNVGEDVFIIRIKQVFNAFFGNLIHLTIDFLFFLPFLLFYYFFIGFVVDLSRRRKV